MREYGPIHVLWSESEEDLVDTLRGVASCIDSCCRAMEKRLSGLSEALLPGVHEYVLYGEMLMVRTPSYTFPLVPEPRRSFRKAVSVSAWHPSSYPSRMLCTQVVFVHRARDVTVEGHIRKRQGCSGNDSGL